MVPGISRRQFLIAAPALASAATAPSTYGALPSPRQLAWHELGIEDRRILIAVAPFLIGEGVHGEAQERVGLRENIRLGQRVEGFELDRWSAGHWETIAKATSIGSCRLIRLADDVTTNRVRLRITQAAACPALSDFGLFREAK
jgi:hypothetical protein